MQKGVFNTWIKELCALVFTQTIQAFILAMVLSIILTFMFPYRSNGEVVIRSQDTVSALGVLCIILLASLTKIEQIAKKIFGLESSLVNNRPPHGLAASLLAIKAAGRIFNNVPKMVGGAGQYLSGRFIDPAKAERNKLRRLSNAGLNMDGTPAGGGALAEGAGAPIPSGGSASGGAMPGTPSTGHFDASYGGEDMPDTNGAVAAMGTSNRPAAKGKSSDYWKIMEKYDDELAAAKKKRSEGIKKAWSGLSETAGASVGLLAGTSVGLATGLATNDLDQIPKAMMTGLGAGDAIGEGLVNAAYVPKNIVSSINSYKETRRKLDKDLTAMEKRLNIQNESKQRAATRLKNVQSELRRINNIDGLE